MEKKRGKGKGRKAKGETIWVKGGKKVMGDAAGMSRGGRTTRVQKEQMVEEEVDELESDSEGEEEMVIIEVVKQKEEKGEKNR